MRNVLFPCPLGRVRAVLTRVQALENWVLPCPEYCVMDRSRSGHGRQVLARGVGKPMLKPCSAWPSAPLVWACHADVGPALNSQGQGGAHEAPIGHMLGPWHPDC